MNNKISIETSIPRELAHEERMARMGQHQYRKTLDSMNAKGWGADNKANIHLMEEMVPTLVHRLQDFLTEAESGKAGQRHSSLKQIRQMIHYMGDRDTSPANLVGNMSMTDPIPLP